MRTVTIFHTEKLIKGVVPMQVWFAAAGTSVVWNDWAVLYYNVGAVSFTLPY